MNDSELDDLVAGAIARGAIQKPEELKPFLEAFIALPAAFEDEPKIIVEVGCDAGGMLWLWQKLGYKVMGITLINGPFSSPQPLNNHGARFIIGDSQDEHTRDRMVAWLEGRKADLVFIDADHTYEGVKRDFELYGPFAQALAFHDIVPHEGLPEVGVWKLWRELGGIREFVKPGAKDGGIGLVTRSAKGWS